MKKSKQKQFKDYMSLTKKQLLEGAKHSYDNSVLHYNAHRLMHRTSEKYQGFASTHLVASIEEITKCILLCLRAHDNKFLREGNLFNKLFKRHEVKHNSFQTIALVTQAYLANYYKTNGDYFMSFMSVLPKIIDLLDAENKYVPASSRKLLIEQMQGDFEEVRKRGFYVDFNGKNWSVPSLQKNSSAYETALKAQFQFVRDNLLIDYNTSAADNLKKFFNMFLQIEQDKNKSEKVQIN